MGTDIARALLKPINTTGPIILGVYSVVWGLWVANPFWDVFSRAPLYNIMGVLAPEWLWGVVALIVGVLMIYGVLRQSAAALMIGAAANGWLWAVVAAFYFIADYMNTGGITSLMICAYGLFVYLNVKVNVWNPQRNRKNTQ